VTEPAKLIGHEEFFALSLEMMEAKRPVAVCAIFTDRRWIEDDGHIGCERTLVGWQITNTLDGIVREHEDLLFASRVP
jgi:hypothetical protein